MKQIKRENKISFRTKTKNKKLELCRNLLAFVFERGENDEVSREDPEALVAEICPEVRHPWQYRSLRVWAPLARFMVICEEARSIDSLSCLLF